MTRGIARSVRFSLNQTHRDRQCFIRQSQSFAISGSGSTAWTHCDHPISIRGPQFAPIFISPWRCVELSRASDFHQTGNAWSSLARQIFIGQRKDQDPIATRSWPDHRVTVATIKRDHGLLHRGINATILPLNRTAID